MNIPEYRAKVEQSLLAVWRSEKLRTFVARRRFSLVLMLIGAGLLGYVGSQYFSMYYDQRALHRAWEQQQQSAVNTSAVKASLPDDGLTRVSIPKINLDLIVVEGTNRHALLMGPGHLKGTPAPGDPGNAVISAHRDTFFRHIYELNKGDLIEVSRGGQTYTFEVTGKKIVQPSDLSVVKNSSQTRLTLITCYPTYYVGPAPERLVVFSKLLPQGQPAQTSAAANPVAAARSGS